MGTDMTGDVSALQLVLTGDPALFAIVRLSLLVSLSAVLFAALIGMPIGALMALTRFRGREGAIVLLLEGTEKNVEKAFEIVESVKGEAPIQVPRHQFSC